MRVANRARPGAAVRQGHDAGSAGRHRRRLGEIEVGAGAGPRRAIASTPRRASSLFVEVEAAFGPRRDALEGDGGGEDYAEGGNRMRLVGALAIVDEELAFGQTLKNRDVSTSNDELVAAAKKKELDRLQRFDAISVVDAQDGLAEMKKRGGKKISTRWEKYEVGGNIKARFVCQALATSVDFFAPATS